MSAPDTDVEKQRKRHAPALMGIKGAIVVGALLLIAVVAVAMMSGADSGATAYEDGEVEETGAVATD